MGSEATTSTQRVRPPHRAILARLDALLRELRWSAPLRRELRTDARPALAARGFASEDLPQTLPPPRQLDLLLTHAQLFGLGALQDVEPGLELRLLAYGAKPVVLVHGQEPELSAALVWAEQRYFTALLSAHEWDRHSDAGKGGYSNLAMNMRRARPGSGAWRSLLVGVDEDRVVLAWLALALGWDELLGRLLGYPECCAAAFPRRWTEAVTEHQGDLVAACLRESGPGPHDWRANVLGRYFGAELTQHFPCRLDCAPTLALAAQVAAVLEACEPAVHGASREVLDAPVIYTETTGVAVLRDGRAERTPGGWTVLYDPARVLVTEPFGALDLALRAGSAVRADAAGAQVFVNDRAFAGTVVLFGEATAVASGAAT